MLTIDEGELLQNNVYRTVFLISFLTSGMMISGGEEKKTALLNDPDTHVTITPESVCLETQAPELAKIVALLTQQKEFTAVLQTQPGETLLTLNSAAQQALQANRHAVTQAFTQQLLQCVQPGFEQNCTKRAALHQKKLKIIENGTRHTQRNLLKFTGAVGCLSCFGTVVVSLFMTMEKCVP